MTTPHLIRVNFLIVTDDFTEFSKAKPLSDIKVPPGSNLTDLQQMVKSSVSPILDNLSAMSLQLWKLKAQSLSLSDLNQRAPFDTFQHKEVSLRAFLDQELRLMDEISSEDSCPAGFLHIIVQLPANEPDTFSASLNIYRNMSIQVEQWGRFNSRDLHLNAIIEDSERSPPLFVEDFLQILDDKPLVGERAQAEYGLIRNPECRGAYIHRPAALGADDNLRNDAVYVDSQSKRFAEPAEIFHISYLVYHNWQLHWGAELSEVRVKEIFLSQLDIFIKEQYSDSMVSQCGTSGLPLTFLMRCTVNNAKQYRKYNPKSDFAIMKFGLPRLLVEVNSGPTRGEWPEDKVRMLLQAISIVRFANELVGRFNKKKDFTLVTIYIAANGRATRYVLFQKRDDYAVYYRIHTFDLKTAVGRVEFVRQLYSLINYLHMDSGDDSIASAMTKLKDTIKRYTDHFPTVSVFSKKVSTDTKKSGESGGRPALNDNDGSELKTYGYKVEVQVEGLEPLYQNPSHIISVRKTMDSMKPLIAKKTRPNSVELKILKRLRAITPGSEHIINVLDSFHTPSASWLILPELTPVMFYLNVHRGAIRSKASQVCWGLIDGLAFLHKLLIAHRDIKPDNLMIGDSNFSLKIIDFDIAIELQDEDEEVGDHCGTTGWTAPEITSRAPKNSPIKADRWACGKTIQYILDKCEKDDGCLGAVSTKLMAIDPQQRPSLLEWRKWKSEPTSTGLVHRLPLPEAGTPPRVKKPGIVQPKWG